ncbi:MAG: hypothetical protein JWM95_3669 [Gemmatimonadetes bacterium]|nr:hypothetical protein [Gemmatimonadota bacterium]
MIRSFSLLQDDSFIVTVADALLPLADQWLPLHGRLVDASINPAASVVDVGRGAAAEAPAMEPVLLRIGNVTAHALDADTVTLHGANIDGRLSLNERSAHITVRDTPHSDEIALSLHHMLTLASAFLLGRMGAALAHAGAVADDAGNAWLFVGDSHSGKTTTCVALTDAGWRFLTDDQVVLRMMDGVLVAEGWPRRAHLNAGYDESRILGVRDSVDLRERWSDRWCRWAPLRAVVLPRVNAHAATSTQPAAGASVMAALIRQSPWLLADKVAAPQVLALLERAAHLTAMTLELGSDTYGKGGLLGSLLQARASL